VTELKATSERRGVKEVNLDFNTEVDFNVETDFDVEK
jgi:hypothetical protein